MRQMGGTTAHSVEDLILLKSWWGNSRRLKEVLLSCLVNVFHVLLVLFFFFRPTNKLFVELFVGLAINLMIDAIIILALAVVGLVDAMR